ncbi:hypothetical protein [Oryza sativa Japonica Group]|uniref:Uncharacterized protein n=1 Tax=Oryza sativa subsp. japonica TaxID=39947 RepID=Q8RUA8_ORYSJ|nr:hypothetical protein [Oryza sativa Japonica Group]BAB90627.1 hypothetical protein [Oryza sativa Japonica Group]
MTNLYDQKEVLKYSTTSLCSSGSIFWMSVGPAYVRVLTNVPFSMTSSFSPVVYNLVPLKQVNLHLPESENWYLQNTVPNVQFIL